MKISPYIIYLEMQPNALLLRQNFIIRKKWVLHEFHCIISYCWPIETLTEDLSG
jgi:hypothetical protein